MPLGRPVARIPQPHGAVVARAGELASVGREGHPMGGPLVARKYLQHPAILSRGAKRGRSFTSLPCPLVALQDGLDEVVVAEFVPSRARPCVTADDVGVLQCVPDPPGEASAGHRVGLGLGAEVLLGNELPLKPIANLPLANQRLLRLAGYLTYRIGVVVAKRPVYVPVGLDVVELDRVEGVAFLFGQGPPKSPAHDLKLKGEDVGCLDLLDTRAGTLDVHRGQLPEEPLGSLVPKRDALIAGGLLDGDLGRAWF